MKLATVSASRRGGLFLSPNNFGEKIEFIARDCGEFKEGEVVVALRSVHDTKPFDIRLGSRFVSVRRLNKNDEKELLELGWKHSFKYSVLGVEGQNLLISETCHISKWGYPGHLIEFEGPVIYSKTRKFSKNDLEITDILWIEFEVPHYQLYFKSPNGFFANFKIPNELSKEILEKVFGFDVSLEISKAISDAEIKARAKSEALEAENAFRNSLITRFFHHHPQAKGWFEGFPSWEDFTKCLVEMNIATFVKSVQTSSYASFSKEYYTFDKIYKIWIDGEIIEFVGGSYTEYESDVD